MPKAKWNNIYIAGRPKDLEAIVDSPHGTRSIMSQLIDDGGSWWYIDGEGNFINPQIGSNAKGILLETTKTEKTVEKIIPHAMISNGTEHDDDISYHVTQNLDWFKGAVKIFAQEGLKGKLLQTSLQALQAFGVG